MTTIDIDGDLKHILNMAAWACYNPVHHSACSNFTKNGPYCDCGATDLMIAMPEKDKEAMRRVYREQQLSKYEWKERKKALYNPVYRPPAAPDIPSGMPNDKWSRLLIGIGLIFWVCLIAFCLSR